MTRRATFTQAELARAIAAAQQAGKVARWTRAGIEFVDPAMIAQTAPTESGQGNTCDNVFGAGG